LQNLTLKFLPKENIDVIRNRVARIIHFLKPPVFALAFYRKNHLAFAFASLAVVDVADSRNNCPFEREFVFVN
jgi:hypothetical protein